MQGLQEENTAPGHDGTMIRQLATAAIRVTEAKAHIEKPQRGDASEEDLPEIEPLSKDELELFTSLVSPTTTHNASRENTDYWQNIMHQMEKCLMTNEELANLVDEIYG
ncbi:hypothetical protein FOMG_16483 [Fusarium oxysporum f. sp. melonis 26406]|uniref:Uncharacterized protein n=1 Tax=Fusarium oxysporum f. sp. melonis 26406 TaxID=1089452 RepID=W9Z6R6_FUSOX|nr:hypothetical protein FOMG_16483 [Fusarium oxysporum f. sp. melonis 26406]